ncbi:MAG: glycosyltransferase family 4 protein, partial [Lentisphaerota bacterium]
GSQFPSNVAAGRHLLEQIAPACPGVDFVVVGAVCQELKDARVSGNVSLKGFVGNLHEVLCECDALVNPVEMATGVNMKVLQALAHGLRVISTKEGARGFEPLIGGPVRIGSLKEFPALIECAERLTPAERRQSGMYDWKNVVSKQLDLYHALLQSKRAHV